MRKPCFSPDDRALRLKEPGETGSYRHYIAVSYCWERSLEQNTSSDENYNVKLGASDRPNKAPYTVISRAITYALNTGTANQVWIDQECIN
jgi:hypothetical protein